MSWLSAFGGKANGERRNKDAQASLAELVHRLSREDEVVITENYQPVARLVKAATQPPTKRKLGTMKGSVLYMAANFDAPPDDFREYIE